MLFKANNNKIAQLFNFNTIDRKIFTSLLYIQYIVETLKERTLYRKQNRF